MITMCFFFKQKTAYEMRISDWSSDVCSSDLIELEVCEEPATGSRRDAPDTVGDVAPPIAADQRHAGSRRQWADLDHINPDAVPEAHEELPELSVDHGDRQETIVVGTLIIGHDAGRSEEHTSELQSLMRIS